MISKSSSAERDLKSHRFLSCGQRPTDSGRYLAVEYNHEFGHPVGSRGQRNRRAKTSAHPISN